MNRQKVTSSNIESIGYDSSHAILEIEFKNGIYQYKKVPENIYKDLMNASSHGKYFYQKIKGVYEYKRISS